MNKDIYHRRGLIKRGLTLIGGVFLLGTARSSFGAAKKAESDKKTKASRGLSTTQHYIEGVPLSLAVRDVGINKD
jgi:hypothetical protein